MFEELREEMKILREQSARVSEAYFKVSDSLLTGTEEDNYIEKMKETIKNDKETKKEKKHEFSYKDIKSKECFTLEDKKQYELQKVRLPFLIYNVDEICNNKDKIIVVTENEKICDCLKEKFSQLDMFTFTTILGGIDRLEVTYLELELIFHNRVVILIGEEEKCENFKEVLEEVTEYIIKQYI